MRADGIADAEDHIHRAEQIRHEKLAARRLVAEAIRQHQDLAEIGKRTHDVCDRLEYKVIVVRKQGQQEQQCRHHRKQVAQEQRARVQLAQGLPLLCCRHILMHMPAVFAYEPMLIL